MELNMDVSERRVKLARTASMAQLMGMEIKGITDYCLLASQDDRNQAIYRIDESGNVIIDEYNGYQIDYTESHFIDWYAQLSKLPSGSHVVLINRMGNVIRSNDNFISYKYLSYDWFCACSNYKTSRNSVVKTPNEVFRVSTGVSIPVIGSRSLRLMVNKDGNPDDAFVVCEGANDIYTVFDSSLNKKQAFCLDKNKMTYTLIMYDSQMYLRNNELYISRSFMYIDGTEKNFVIHKCNIDTGKIERVTFGKVRNKWYDDRAMEFLNEIEQDDSTYKTIGID